jgi:hypothetical protein
MGIEYIARALRISSNHGVASSDERCVRFLCEEHCHSSQRQPMRALRPGLSRPTACSSSALSVSRATLMRAVRAAGPEVLTIGRARRTSYAAF